MTTELLVVIALVLANGLFAGAEIAILSVRKTRVQERANQGHRGARAVQTLRDEPERFLATVQIGITVVGSAAAVYGGSNIARDLTPILERAGLGAYAHDVALASVITSISILSLVLGELVPKSLALRHPDGYAFLVSRPLLGLASIARPFVWFLTAASNLVLRMFGDRTSFTEARMSRDELQQLVEEAANSGSVDTKTSEIASRALDLVDLQVSEVMVRREEIVAIDTRASTEEVQRVILEQGHSRMPVYDGTLDHLIGYVIARDLLAVLWERGRVVIDDIVRPLHGFPLSARINVVLREMQSRRVQIAAVVDEHGGTAGIVTIEDLVEELIGDVIDEDEAPDQTVHTESATSATVAGWVPIRTVNRALGTALPIAREHTTMAGLCMALALAVPPAGTRLHAPDGTTIDVLDASPKRVRMVRVLHHPRHDETAPAESQLD